MGMKLKERAGGSVRVSDGGEGVIFIPGEMIAADEIMDRFEIEVKAAELIATRSQNYNSYKTSKNYHDDARTAIFEALTASGHLSVVTSKTATLEEIHEDMLTVLLNAWSDNLPEFEKRRRFQEICEELTIQQIENAVAEGKLADDTEVATISDYIVGATDKQAMRLGYRPYNKKGMVRSSRLIDHKNGTFTRVSKQVSRSNSDAVESERFLITNDIKTRNESTPDVRVLGVQTILTGETATAGVLGILKRLDQFKGANFRYGEEVNDDQISYEDLEQESRRREEEAECYINRLAEFSYNLDKALAESKINAVQHQELLQEEVYKILQSICTMRPDYAIDCFGAASYETYKTAALMTASGDVVGAAGFIQAGRHLEQTVTLCGMSIPKQEAEAKGLQTDSLSELLKFGTEKFKTKVGKCRVPECPSPKPTEVGPCDVCMTNCQPKFNKGMSYSKIVRMNRKINALKKVTSKTFKFLSFTNTPEHSKKAA